ncbi:hypothetical protein [Lachnoclostridium sp. Marseille-P6806]|nr:hypothetical protein [Lachnoclostridium sp. Marseille-P6806]
MERYEMQSKDSGFVRLPFLYAVYLDNRSIMLLYAGKAVRVQVTGLG